MHIPEARVLCQKTGFNIQYVKKKFQFLKMFSFRDVLL